MECLIRATVWALSKKSGSSAEGQTGRPDDIFCRLVVYAAHDVFSAECSCGFSWVCSSHLCSSSACCLNLLLLLLKEVIVVGGTGVFLMLLVTDGWVLHVGNSNLVE